MREKPWSVKGEQVFDLVRLCRYFSELSPQPMVAVEGMTHIVRHLNAAFSRLIGKEAAELTAYAGEEDHIRTLRAGFHLHVPKPISPDELVRHCRHLAGRTG